MKSNRTNTPEDIRVKKSKMIQRYSKLTKYNTSWSEYARLIWASYTIKKLLGNEE